MNELGLSVKDYQGAVSTLCTGCGHDSVTAHIVQACYRSNVDPRSVAKISGIGCSSKTPAYFLPEAHGFNTIHGRMAAVATGAHLANRDLKIIGVSGDGDTASIGLGGFLHTIRRQVPMVYLIENNGVYGLTKGQFSATADKSSPRKSGERNLYSTFDLCAMAIEAGCQFVARAFSGDGKLLVPLIQAALDFPGTAVIDVVSPCIIYANHEGSTKSYDYVRQHKVNLQELGFISESEQKQSAVAPGGVEDITLSSGRVLRIRRLRDDHDFRDRANAVSRLHQSAAKNEILTGLIYMSGDAQPLAETLQLTRTPLRDLHEDDLRANGDHFERLISEFR